MSDQHPRQDLIAELEGMLADFRSSRTASDDEIAKFIKRFVALARRGAQNVESEGRFGRAEARCYRLVSDAYREAARRSDGERRDEYSDMAEFWDLALRRNLLRAGAEEVQEPAPIAEFERPSPPVQPRNPKTWSSSRRSRVRSSVAPVRPTSRDKSLAKRARKSRPQ